MPCGRRRQGRGPDNREDSLCQWPSRSAHTQVKRWRPSLGWLAIAGRGLRAGAGDHRGIAVAAYLYIRVVDARAAVSALGQFLQVAGSVLHPAIGTGEQPVLGQQRGQRRCIALQAQAAPVGIGLFERRRPCPGQGRSQQQRYGDPCAHRHGLRENADGGPNRRACVVPDNARQGLFRRCHSGALPRSPRRPRGLSPARRARGGNGWLRPPRCASRGTPARAGAAGRAGCRECAGGHR